MASLTFHALAGQSVAVTVTTTAVRVQIPACNDVRIYSPSANTADVARAVGTDNTVVAVFPIVTGAAVSGGTQTGGVLGDMPIPPGAIEVARAPNKTGTTGVWVSLVAAAGTQTVYVTPGDGI